MRSCSSGISVIFISKKMKEHKMANKQETLHCGRSVPQILLDTAENNEIYNSKLCSNQTIEQKKLFLSDSILNTTKKAQMAFTGLWARPEELWPPTDNYFH